MSDAAEGLLDAATEERVVMQVLVPVRSRARYRLGAAPAPGVRKMLADPATGQFSNYQFETFKNIAIDLKNRAEQDYARILQMAQSVGWTSSDAEEEAAARLLNDGLPRTRAFLDQATARMSGLWDANAAIWDDPEAFGKFLGLYQTEIANLQKDAEYLQTASDLSFYKSLTDQALALAKTLADVGQALIDAAKAAADAAKKGAEGVGFFARNWVWIVGAAILVPFGIRAYLAYKEGGSKGALRYTAEGIERGRGRVADAGKAAVKAGASAASGGAISGLRKRRRRRK